MDKLCDPLRAEKFNENDNEDFSLLVFGTMLV